MRSAWSAGILMIVMAGMGVSGMGGARPTPAAWALAGLLVVGGILMFMRKPIAFFVTVGAALLLAVSGVVAYFGHPELALPMHPMISIVIGLYLSLRAVLARPALRPRPEPS
jgi:hypothetical protein